MVQYYLESFRNEIYSDLPRTKTYDSRKAGRGPQNLFCLANASKRYAYSAPLRGTTVPNSAKHSAPVNIKTNLVKVLLEHFKTIKFT